MAAVCRVLIFCVLDIGQSVCRPALRVYAVELAGFNQRVADGRTFIAFFGSEKQIVLSANGNLMTLLVC